MPDNNLNVITLTDSTGNSQVITIDPSADTVINAQNMNISSQMIVNDLVGDGEDLLLIVGDNTIRLEGFLEGGGGEIDLPGFENFDLSDLFTIQAADEDSIEDSDVFSADDFNDPLNTGIIGTRSLSLEEAPEFILQEEDGLTPPPTGPEASQPLSDEPDTEINPSNSQPNAQDDSIDLDGDEAVTFDVLENDSDADNDTLTILSNTEPSKGTLVLNEDGTFTYTPDEDFTGTDSFTYTVDDGNGGTDSATVTVNGGELNHAPEFISGEDEEATDINDDSYSFTIDEGGEISDLVGTVHAEDIDGDDVTYSIDGSEEVNSLFEINSATGQITLKQGLDDAEVGEYNFTVITSDGEKTDTAQVSITVNNINDIPDAVDDSVSTNEDTPITIDVLANDSDEEQDTLSIDSVTEAENGTVTIVDGEILYTPNENFHGEDTFDYTISDGNGGTNTATVSVTVDSVNDAPEAGNYLLLAPTDQLITLEASELATDVEGDPLSLSSIENFQKFSPGNEQEHGDAPVDESIVDGDLQLFTDKNVKASADYEITDGEDSSTGTLQAWFENSHGNTAEDSWTLANNDIFQDTNIIVKALDGADSLTINQTAFDTLKADMGAGDDTVSLHKLEFGNELVDIDTGADNDTIILTDVNVNFDGTINIDGGSNTLVEEGQFGDLLSIDFDLDYDSSSSSSLNLDNIENISLEGNGSQTLSLDLEDVIDITDANNTLFIEGDSTDFVDLSDSFSYIESADGYDLYSSIDNVNVYIQDDISLVNAIVA